VKVSCLLIVMVLSNSAVLLPFFPFIWVLQWKSSIQIPIRVSLFMLGLCLFSTYFTYLTYFVLISH
jgi:hypothetical protein